MIKLKSEGKLQCKNFQKQRIITKELIELLTIQLSNQNWDKVYLAKSVNEKYNISLQIFKNNFSTYCTLN